MVSQQAAVALCVPAEPRYARAVRMLAATLAVNCDMSVDEVEDVRIAAEEGFVYSCATAPEVVDVRFLLKEDAFEMEFGLGQASIEEVSRTADAAPLDLVELLLSAVCDDYGVSDDDSLLHLVKKVGVAHA